MACSLLGYILVVIATLSVTLAVGLLHVLNWWDYLVVRDVFERTAEEAWTTYSSQIADSKWMLYMWVAVYGLQIFWICYGFEICIRKPSLGTLYSEIPILPPSVFIFYSLGVVSTFANHLLWVSTNLHDYAPIAMVVSSSFAYISLFVAASALNRHANNLQKDIRFVYEGQWLVHNALGSFSAMTTIVLFYQISGLTHSLNRIGENGSSYLLMALILFYITIWLIFDTFIAKRLLPYTLTPYLMCTAIFVQIFYLHINDHNNFFMMSVIFLGLSIFVTIVKIWNASGIACEKKY